MGTAFPPNHTYSKDTRLTKLQLLYVTCEDDHPVNLQLHPVPGARLFQDAPVPARLRGSYKQTVPSQIMMTEADNMHSLNKRTLETLKAEAPVLNGPVRLVWSVAQHHPRGSGHAWCGSLRVVVTQQKSHTFNCCLDLTDIPWLWSGCPYYWETWRLHWWSVIKFSSLVC